jgi:hypothetical protein
MNELTARKAVQDYLGENHNFAGDILDDAWAEMRWMEFVSDAMKQAGLTDEDMQTEDRDGECMYVHAVDEVQQHFIRYLQGYLIPTNLQRIKDKLRKFVKKHGLRDDWHEPLEVKATVKGRSFDNAMGDKPGQGEKVLTLKAEDDVLHINLATLCALATL